MPHKALAAASCGLFIATSCIVPGSLSSQELPQRSFEIAVVKPNLSGQQQMTIATPPSGAFTATNVNAQTLVLYAFDLPAHRVVGLADWTVSERFDIVARAKFGASPGDVKAMLRDLLAKRFALTTHVESRVGPVDVITRIPQARATGLKISEDRCPSQERCGVYGTAFGLIEGRDGTLAQLAAELTSLTRRTVLDQTSDTGRYDFRLAYTPDALVMRPEVRAAFPGVDPDGPALATALREQLGVRLQAGTAPTDVMVIDQLKRPALEN